jgi:hypothetical protein
METEQRPKTVPDSKDDTRPGGDDLKAFSRRVKFEFWGNEMLEKPVTASGNSGRVYLPTSWVGRWVKIIRID